MTEQAPLETPVWANPEFTTAPLDQQFNDQLFQRAPIQQDRQHDLMGPPLDPRLVLSHRIVLSDGTALPPIVSG